jgi:hypothetical protein
MLLNTTVAISLLPLSVIFAYISRVALIARRTAAFGPFIPKSEQQRISGQVQTVSQDSDEEKDLSDHYSHTSESRGIRRKTPTLVVIEMIAIGLVMDNLDARIGVSSENRGDLVCTVERLSVLVKQRENFLCGQWLLRFDLHEHCADPFELTPL